LVVRTDDEEEQMAGMRGSIAARRGGAGTRGGLGRIAAMAVGLVVLLVLAMAGEAHAGRYRVVQCGWGVGAELDPTHPTTEGTAVSLEPSTCAPAPGWGPVGIKFEGGIAPDGAPGMSRARWVAPAGTRFAAIHLTWSGDLQTGNWRGLGVDVGDQFQLLAGTGESSGPTPVDLATGDRAWAFEAWLQCLFVGPVARCTRSRASTMRLSGVTFTLEDSQPPQVQLGGPLPAAGWHRGTAAFELDAADVGAGIAAEVAWIDGTMILAALPACSLQPVEGELRGTKMQPCPPTASRTVEVDTTRLADGAHRLRGCANDFSTGQGCAPDAIFEVDNSPPAISFASAAEGEVAATVSDRYSGPASGAISVRRGEAEAWTDLATTIDAEGDGTATVSARLPDLRAGTYLFRAVAADAAGNSGSAQLRVAGGPAALRRQAADGHGHGDKGSGPGGGGPVPRRRATHLTAHLGADRGTPGSPLGESALTVDYGTAALVRGRRTDAHGAAVAGRPVVVGVRAAAGIGPGPERRRVLSDREGRFGLRLPPGTSRRVTVAFHGGGGFAPARRRSLTLRVRAGLGLTADPTELRTGGSVHLRGRVRLGPARVSGRGKLIAIQYLERATKRWRPALVVRTDAEGRFDTSYRFRYVTGVARIRLRATAPAEGGWPFARGSSPPVTVTVRSG
jgi:hypothetical protein